MRDLRTVIDSILVFIPAAEVDLIAGLKAEQNSLLYAAPEEMGRHWGLVSELLYERIGDKCCLEWQRIVCSIWCNQLIP